MTLTQTIAQAGIVGCGGAGFPTHVKVATAADTLLVNAAECEPLLGTDRFLLREHAAEICAAAEAVRAHLGASAAVIVLKESYRAEIAALDAVLPQYPQLRRHTLTSFYPAGDEQTLVYEVTGRSVPPGGLPGAVGCIVSNAATLYAVWQALQGRAFTQKYVTINGAVRSPCILKVPIGTPLADCLEAAGGASVRDYTVVSGGPMMGKVLSADAAASACVTKTTSGFLLVPTQTRLVQNAVLSEPQTVRRARAACIQCTFCTQLCPRNLIGHPLAPHAIMRKIGGGNWRARLASDPTLQSAALCCECGICELYACPMQLQPRKVNALIKAELRTQGIRPPAFALEEVRPMREYRRVPTGRVAARAGVEIFSGYVPTRFVSLTPHRVCIALNSHIGVSAQPIVAVGERVALGQCIARPPADKLGAAYHASMDGTVTDVGEHITIER